MTRWALAAALALMAGCVPPPDSYPVPEQRPAVDGPEPEQAGPMVRFADPRSMDQLVSGFLRAAPDQLWRWGSENPTVQVRVDDTRNLRLRANFAFPEESHTPLLPITVRYSVNDHLLDTVTYRKAGALEYKKPVPAEWLRTDSPNVIRMEVSPVYIAKEDGVKLSVVLTEIGLEPNN
jgi:hypothetical protein